MTKEQLSSAEIKKACDILRRDDWVWSKNYITEISWILFLKLFEEIENIFDDISASKMQDYHFVIEEKYHWSSWAHDKEYRKNPEKMLDFVRWKLFPYLKLLSGDYGTKIAQIFNTLVQPKILSWYNLIDVVDIVDKINKKDFVDSHLLSHAYEEILAKMWNEWWWAWEYYTPRSVIKFLIHTLDPQVWQKIKDPFTWSWWFLVESFEYLKQKSNWDTLSTKEQKKLADNSLFWQEKKQEWYILWMMNLITHGVLKPNINLANTFGQDLNNITWEYDVILTNPPFWGKEASQVYKHYEYPTSATEWLALQYIMKTLKNGWKAWVVLPDGQILFATGLFADIRQKLFEKNKLKYIISLPAWVFAQMWTGIKTVCMIFEKWWNTKNVVYYNLNWKYTKKKLLPLEDMESILEDMKQVDIFDKNLDEKDIDAFNIAWEDTNQNFDRWVVPLEYFENNNYDISPKNPFEKKDIVLSVDENLSLINKGNTWFTQEFENLKKLLKDNDLV